MFWYFYLLTVSHENTFCPAWHTAVYLSVFIALHWLLDTPDPCETEERITFKKSAYYENNIFKGTYLIANTMHCFQKPNCMLFTIKR